MNHNIYGKKLNRDTNQRQALVRGLAGAMVRSEAIETTEAKAQAAQGLIEKLITHARRATLNDLRQIESVLINKDLVHKLVHGIAPRFKDRPGGYTRLIKLGTRAGDNAQMVRMELVNQLAPQPKPSASATPASPTPAKPSSTPVKKATKTRSTAKVANAKK